ncbi:MAG: hypothetical protein B6I32_06350 [Desulfobacterium sp. 4572_20]|nr:MAG: hypothetical protein B6I32_06350 [Desulfobacterium sp. 4572_20]
MDPYALVPPIFLHKCGIFSISWVIVSSKNQKKETVMEQEIHITLRCNLAIGKVGLNAYTG